MPDNQLLLAAAQAWATKEFGGTVTVQDSVLVIGGTPALALAGNPERVGLLFMNLGINPVNIGLTSGVGVTNGVLLVASGGFLSMNVRDDFILPSWPWFATSSGAGNVNVYCLEVIRIAVS